MKNQQLMRDALHIATLLPPDRRDSDIVLEHVRELVAWGSGTTDGTVVELRPGLPRRPKRARSVPYYVAIAACLVAFFIGYLDDPPWAMSTLKTGACSALSQPVR